MNRKLLHAPPKVQKSIQTTLSLAFFFNAPYFSVLFGKKVNKRESSMGSSSWHLLGQS